MLEGIPLSPAALELFRLHVERQGRIDVDDGNREAYRELEAAGLVLLGRPFTATPRYHLTREGFERKLAFSAASLPGCASPLPESVGQSREH